MITYLIYVFISRLILFSAGQDQCGNRISDRPKLAFLNKGPALRQTPTRTEVTGLILRLGEEGTAHEDDSSTHDVDPQGPRAWRRKHVTAESNTQRTTRVELVSGPCASGSLWPRETPYFLPNCVCILPEDSGSRGRGEDVPTGLFLPYVHVTPDDGQIRGGCPVPR